MARVAATLAILLLAFSGARAEPTPTEALQQVFARANDILTDPESAERPLDRLLGVRKLVIEAFDFRGAAELASGDHWRARTAAEQEEFTWLFSDLLERAFVSRMASKASLDGGTRIRYLDESIDGDTALVQTAMARRNGAELMLDYRLVERAGLWKIRDVAIDGVSLMANYRAQLDRVLGNASFPELLSQMRAKAGVAEPPEPPMVPVDAPPPAAAAVADVSPPVETVSAKEGSPPVEAIVVMDVSPSGSELRVATFEPAVDVPAIADPPVAVLIEEPATTPVDGPITARAEPSTPPRAVTAPPRPPTTRAYWLRMMAAGSVEDAGRLVSRLRAGKLPVAVDRKNGGHRILVSVRVGPFRNAEDAVLKLLDLQTRGHDPYLVAERD